MPSAASNGPFRGLLLTGVAGWVDAVGFIRLGGFYPSFMSGNTTRLGVALSDEHWGLVTLAALILALFFFGSFAGGLTAALPPRWRLAAVLAMEGAVLLVALLMVFTSAREEQTLLLLPIAMGVQNGAIHELRHPPGGTTFVTGSLFSAGHGLAQARVGVPGASWLPSLVVWLLFAIGAAAGAVADLHWGLPALAVPLAGVAALAIVAIALPPRTPETAR